MFYVIAAALTAVVVAYLLRPLLLRGTVGPLAGGAEELAVFKAQLAEIERDLKAGTLPTEEAEIARREVERRILAADAADRRAATIGPPRRGLALALLLCLLIGGPALYLTLGEPDQPAQPYAEREDVQMHRSLQERAAELRAALAENPDDVEGWLNLAMLRAMLDQHGGTVEAYRQAIIYGAEEAGVFSALAEALIFEAQGQVTEEARQVLSEALKRDANDPLALYYLGHALEQDERYDLALQLWSDMAAVLPEDSRWYLRLQEDIARVSTMIRKEE